VRREKFTYGVAGRVREGNGKRFLISSAFTTTGCKPVVGKVSLVSLLERESSAGVDVVTMLLQKKPAAYQQPGSRRSDRQGPVGLDQGLLVKLQVGSISTSVQYTRREE